MKTKHAEREFEILEETTKDAVVLEFKEEILSLVDKFMNSGQSGGSVGFVSSAIYQTVKKLCMFEPIAPITGQDDEWVDISEGRNCYVFQNNRLSSVFKKAKNEDAYYLNGIIFKGDISISAFSSNSVKMPNGKKIKSTQYIKSFPFTPKTFYIDVIESRFDKDKDTGVLTPNPDGDWWKSVVKDPSQLDEVAKYYNLKFYE